jgi:WhiB family redox-sensing transcriptional regulator
VSVLTVPAEPLQPNSGKRVRLMRRTDLQLVVNASGRAKCRDMNAEDFFPVIGERGVAPKVGATRAKWDQAALALCAGCPIMAECRELALRDEAGVDGCYGVRGGLMPWARRELIQARGRTAQAGKVAA